MDVNPSFRSSAVPEGRPDEGLTGRHLLLGRARVHRVGWWGFPVHELRQEGERLAAMGHAGWFRIFFGRGQRVELTDGTRWLLCAVSAGSDIWPLIVDTSRRKVAVAASVHGTYGINTRDAAYVLYPAGSGRHDRRSWRLRQFEDEVAALTRDPQVIDTIVPVPLGVVLLSFVLARYGLPSDSAAKVPAFTWG